MRPLWSLASRVRPCAFGPHGVGPAVDPRGHVMTPCDVSSPARPSSGAAAPCTTPVPPAACGAPASPRPRSRRPLSVHSAPRARGLVPASPAAVGVDPLFMCLLSGLCTFSGETSIPLLSFASGLSVLLWVVRVLPRGLRSLTVRVICSRVLPCRALPFRFLCDAL